MKIGLQVNSIVINKQANSLHSLIADGKYRSTSLGRHTWKKLIGQQASLQRNCNHEGFNSYPTQHFSRARIGIISNDLNECNTPDSRIGFGSGGHPYDDNTCGNTAWPWYEPDNGGKNIKAMGYILVLKEPTPLFEKSRGHRPGGVVKLHTSHHSYHSHHGLGGYSKLINGLRAAGSEAFVY